ncbi:DNA translocase FtsK [Aquihabitans sp. G128]|uniref:FtsK/SpoIIIE family DNA translocase n=1 Tax=Aquihabitans sp. G128 TaxID=2849779 RepID=UPI001C217A93|nr:DNA translocase FtsK [Aquihabitans sp. G128]QXC62414.1 DNA translocase FtsK [Aquihabitans sp. G128]
MTATRRTPKGSGAKKKPAARSTSKRPPARKPTAAPRARKAAAPPPKPSVTSRVLASLAAASRGHGADFAGLLLVVVGLVAGLGVYGRAGGPAGRGMATLMGTLFGAARVLAPPVLVALGVLLVRGAPAPPEADPDDPTLVAEEVDLDQVDHPFARLALGSFLLAVAGMGLLHLFRQAPDLGAGRDAVADSAGYVGAVIGGPLHGALGQVGAGLLLAAIGFAGALVVTRTTISAVVGSAAGGVAKGARPVGGAARRAVGQLFQIGGQSDAAEADGEDLTFTGPAIDLRDGVEPTGIAPGFYDQDTDVDPDAPAAAPKRARKPKAAVPVPDPDVPPEQLEISLPPGTQPSNWKLPPSKLLDRSGSQAVDRTAVEETGRRLEHALAEHGVETRLVGMTVGPTVTRFELELGPGVKVARVTSLHKDIAYAMATPDVRILAPIPGKQAIGVEIPNVRKQLVTVGDILMSAEARAATHPLEVAIGRDIDGKAILANLAAMPHILIAGATGAGKSSCLNSLLTSILMRSTPDQVRMILVDPKRVEMGQYNKLPHLLTEVVTVPKKAANALAWAVREMERRYDLLAECGFRDITGFNAAFDRGDLNDPNAELLGPDAESVTTYERMPFILVVIDELADLMMVAARDVEESICRLAQMARAVGIHLVIATQRPSVNVITGLIKANVPARLAFAVSSATDSRVILDQTGAERLLGKGDMLLLGPSSSVAQRVQGSWVTEEEVRNIAAFWKRQTPDLVYAPDVQGSDDDASGAPGLGSGSGGGSGSAGGDSDDDLVAQATELVVRSQLGSTSMLQRKLRVGFARAGRLMDELEERGVVGPSTGSKAREVLMTPEELDGGGQGGGGDDLPAGAPVAAPTEDSF